MTSGERLLVVGTGTIGLLVAQFAGADGVEVHLAGISLGRGWSLPGRVASVTRPRSTTCPTCLSTQSSTRRTR